MVYLMHCVYNKYLLRKLSLLLAASLLQLVSAAKNDDSVSEWSPYCNEDVYYKPYVRIKDGRTGPVIKDLGPGFHDVKDLENIYVCSNGLVFLYFKIHKELGGEIFDEATMQHASHFCGFYNGKTGPDTGERNVSLVAILLLGQAKDYRQVAVQMFTAPLRNPTTNVTANFTSLAIINTEGECILEKGNERARIRIKGNPSEEIQQKTYEATEEHHTTICRLDGNLLMQDDESKLPLDSEWVSKEEALYVLAQNNSFADLRLVGCYQYPLLDTHVIQIVEHRKNETTQPGFDIGQEKSELNPEDGNGLKFWNADRISKYGSPTDAPAENATLTDEVNSKNETLQTELAKNSTDQDKKVIHDAKSELNFAILKQKLAPYLTHYQKMFEGAKTSAKGAIEAWEKVSTLVSDETVRALIQNYTKVQEALSFYQLQQVSEPYNRQLLEVIENLNLEKQTFKEQLWQKSLEAGPLITKAEVMSARRSAYVADAKAAMESIQRLIEAAEKRTTALDSKWDYKEGQQVYKDVVVSVKNPAGSTDNPACLTFERKADQCKAIKPSAKRACQLAKVKQSGPGDWPGGDGDKWRDDLLELMNKIFSKGCNRLQDNFAKGINNIVKGYLTKKPDVEPDKDAVAGSPDLNRIRESFIINYNISKPEDLYPSLPGKDGAPWDEILEKLQKCEETVEPLKISVKISSSSPISTTFNGAALSTTVEQADMEFSFNWAVDSHFRIFGTVLGLCLKEFEDPLDKTFYEGYTKSFLDPIRPIWLSNRDNPIFKVVMGQYYTTGKGDFWTKMCMDAVFHGKENVRPLRNLYVNGFTERNFIVKK